MNDVQSHLLEMLSDFDWAMRKDGVRYFMAYGTALGAVRHKGFIPWDDDVDVFIMRKDVPAFETAMEHLSPYYILQRPFELDWPDAFYKVKLDGSYVDEGNYPDCRLNHGLFIDVFVLDGYPDSKPRRLIHDIFAFAAHASDVMSGKCINKPVLDPIQKLLVLNIKVMHRLMDMMLDHEDSELLLNRCVEWDYTKRRVFDDVIDMEFEGRQFMMPKEWDLMLTDYFGDYMTPPPEDERVGHHIRGHRLCDTPKLYLENKDGKISDADQR